MMARPRSVDPKSEQLRLRLTKGQKAAVERWAGEAGVSVQEWVMGKLGFGGRPQGGGLIASVGGVSSATSASLAGLDRVAREEQPRTQAAFRESLERESPVAKLFASGRLRRGSEVGKVKEASPPGPVEEVEEEVVVPPKLRQRILATREANPGMGLEELVRRFEGVIPGSGAAVRRVVMEQEG